MTTRKDRNVRRIVPSIEASLHPDRYYEFDLDQNSFPVFSDKNIAFVNGLVNNDSNYTWIDQGTIHDKYVDASNGDACAIREAVYFTNKMNSTHLAAVTVKGDQDKLMGKMNAELKRLCEIKEDPQGGSGEKGDEGEAELTGGTLITAAYLVSQYANNNKLGSSLLEKDFEFRANLVASIARATTNMTYKLLPEEDPSDLKCNRSNFSFATKFCHHGCRNLSRREVNGSYIYDTDNFCIYDTVVGTMLPYYADAYIDYGSNESEWLNEWCKKYNDTPLSRYGNRYAWIRGTINKLVATPDEDVENADTQVARGYLGYLDLYSHIVDGINEWRKQENQTVGSNNGSAPDIGFHEVDLMIWYFFKGSRLDKAKDKMK